MMRPLFALLLACALACAPCIAAPVTINAEGQKLLEAANALSGQGKWQDALAAYDAADKADPESSLALSSKAGLLYAMSNRAAGDERLALMRRAIEAAQAALGRNGADPAALEFFRVTNQDAPSPEHRINAAAEQQLQAGENLFAQKRYAEALVQYELAAASDPQSAQPWVFAGDCFYAQGQWTEAEPRFRKATVIEPLSGQGWRFLADALLQQSKFVEAENALFGGIAAQPSQMPTWLKLASVMQRAGTPLKRLNFRMKASVKRNADGKTEVQIDESVTKVPDTADAVFWISYSLLQSQRKTPPGFAGDYDLLRQAMQIDAEIAAKGKVLPFADPALAALRKLNADGRLEAGMLLLLYRESYRPALESWKAAHPDGVREFVVATGLRP